MYFKNILIKNPDPQYYNKEVKRLKLKIRKMRNKRKFGQPYQVELKRLSKGLLVATGLTNRSYKTKVDAGQSSVSMLNDAKKIEKVFQRSRTTMVSAL